MNKQCTQCSKTFRIDDQDVSFYKKIAVPEPTQCPVCRQQRRLVWRNERNFYPRTCDMCHTKIISAYSPQVERPVYCSKCWWSDRWDPFQFGQAINWDKPFFEQFEQMQKQVPAIALMNDNQFQSENCEYTYDFAFGKNAYMVVCSWHVEDCMYSYRIARVKDVYDSTLVFDSELIYEGSIVERSYRCAFVKTIKDCRDVMFGYDLRGCSDCLFSAQLRNKQYCIWNVQYTKEEYEAKKRELKLDSWANLQKYQEQFKTFVARLPKPYANFQQCTDCTGDNLLLSKNARDSFGANKLEDCRYFFGGDAAKDCYDITDSGNPELCYESVTPDNSYNNMFTVFCWKSQFLLYSENCHSSVNLFGCVGIRNSKNSILNKQYSEQEYTQLKQKLIDHMRNTGEYGELFPIQLSSFSYNESVAQEIIPLTQIQSQQKGYHWQTALPYTTGLETVTSIPDSITETSDTICSAILACEICKRNYRILPQEYKLYQNFNIPLPRHCIECRYIERKRSLNTIDLWQRQCMCTQTDHKHQGRCPDEFETTYDPSGLDIVYCAPCYQKEIY